MPPAVPVAGLILLLGAWPAWRFLRRARSDRRYRKAGRQRERAWEEMLRSLHVQTLVLANSALGIAHVKDRRIQWANPRWGEIFGVPAGNLVGASMAPFHADQAAFEAFGRDGYAAIERDGRFKGEVRFRRVDGSPFWGFLVGSLLESGRPEEGAVWCLEDVSDRVEAQQERDDALKLNQKLIAASPAGITLYRAADGACILANQAAARIAGARVEDLLGQNFRRNPAWAESGLLVGAEAALAGGDPQVLEAAMTTSFGQVRDLACTFVPFESRGGRMLLMMASDVTERTRLVHELKQKNEELETLVHVASHDLRSPLVNIQGFSQRLGKSLAQLDQQLEQGGSPEDLRAAARPLVRERMPAALDYIRASGVKMDAIINGLLRLSRAGRLGLRPEVLDMDRILEAGAAALAFQLQEADGELRLEPLPPCKADPVQTAQVFSNLLDNAIKYRHGERPLSIRVSGRLQGAQAVYWVEDNGIGIPPAHRARVFDIFQRLDPQGPTRGEGLGLTLVRRMVERNGGRVWVESGAEGGSRFCVELPAV